MLESLLTLRTFVRPLGFMFGHVICEPRSIESSKRGTFRTGQKLHVYLVFSPQMHSNLQSNKSISHVLQKSSEGLVANTFDQTPVTLTFLHSGQMNS